MIILPSIQAYPSTLFPIVTMGSYDGIHLGHQEIIKKMVADAHQLGGESVIITFYPHPRTVLNPTEAPLLLLNSEEEKQLLFASFGVDYLIIHPFDLSFAKVTAKSFITDYLVKSIGVKKLVIGYNHQFGNNREGSFQDLLLSSADYGFQVEQIPAHQLNDMNISSTKIRQALEIGDVHIAHHFLGYPYPINGKVIKGNQVGRKIGFPTANIGEIYPQKLIPCDGVYAVLVYIENDSIPKKGMLNIGVRPTLHLTQKTIEVHIFDFNQDIYTKAIRVEFIHRLRNEQRFSSLEELTKQLELDKTHSLKYLSQ